MAKMYTLDKKLLIGSPEIRIGDEVFPIDDREKNVKKIMKLFNEAGKDDMDKADEAFKLAFGENYKKIEDTSSSRNSLSLRSQVKSLIR